jgi:hypothetical protein
MSLFLLVLGAATAAAGFVLVALGVILPEGTVGVEVVTPGTIAAVGGLILVGMALVVRQLQQIERALTGRPAVRAVPHEEPAFSAAKSPAAAGRLPFPPKVPVGPNPPPLPAAAIPTLPPAEVAALETPPAIPAALGPLESAQAMEEADLSLAPQTLAHAHEGIREAKEVAAIGRVGNGARPIRPVPRVVARGHQSAASDVARGAVLNAFWPDKSRAGNGAASADVASLTPQLPPRLPPGTAAPVAAVTPTIQPEAAEPVAPAPISILKSGVVEGMAYTLYSDGSIEAQLPQGTLRFGSIEALRNHIENDAQPN